MLLSKHQPLAVCACIAFACSAFIAACGGGVDAHGLQTFQAASLVLGQPDFLSGQPNQGGNASASSLSVPMGLALDPSGGLLVTDSENNRVLFFSSMSQANGGSADVVLGQESFGSTSNSVSRAGMSGPSSVAVGAGRMAIVDRSAHRVLIYDEIPAPDRPRPEPSVVIGQRDFTSNVHSCGASGLADPWAVAITPDGKLIVADTGNNRLLVWNQIPAAGTAVSAPSLVLGQSDADHCAFADDNQDGAPDGGTIAYTVTNRVTAPKDVWSDGRRLVVADTQFHRVLIWNQFPTSNFQPADLVLGQPNFTGRHPNAARHAGEEALLTGRTFFFPRGVHSDGISLAVADLLNNRVLIWSTFPEVSYQPADIVLGHAGFEQSATNDLNRDGNADAPNAQVLNNPTRVLFSADALFVSDGMHSRVLKYRR